MRWITRLFSREDAPRHGAEAEGPPLPGAKQPAATPPAAGPPGDWDTYLREGPGGRESVALDLALADRAPDPERPLALRARYALASPREDGLAAGAEGEALARVEDGLERALAAVGAIYAGRVTAGGGREHLYYLAAEEGVAAALEAAAPALAGYQVEAATEPDPEWRAYLDDLHPTPRVRAWLADRRTVEALARHGDRPGVPRPVEHQVAFPDRTGRDAFLAELAAQGYEVRAVRDDGPPPNCHAAQLVRAGPVTLSAIHEVTWALRQAARRHGGEYRGWEAPVVTAGAPATAS
jgi:hypothetical protein